MTHFMKRLLLIVFLCSFIFIFRSFTFAISCTPIGCMFDGLSTLLIVSVTELLYSVTCIQ